MMGGERGLADDSLPSFIHVGGEGESKRQNTEYHLYEIKMRRMGTKRVKGSKERRVGNDERSDKRREGRKEKEKGHSWSC